MNKVEMLVGRTLLRPLKPIKVSKKVSVPDEEKNKDLKPGDVKETKVVKQKVYANFQLAEVVAISEFQKTYSVGDTVVFKPGRDITLDLVPDAILVNDFDIIGKWIEDKSLDTVE